jgi:asparagine synthase (glutamine-hydrolysing)
MRVNGYSLTGFAGKIGVSRDTLTGWAELRLRLQRLRRPLALRLTPTGCGRSAAVLALRQCMAVGLEVRVPFCDHRLVDYVFNIPWHLKTFDGREKSILRAATRELLPNSIVERQKNPYPSTQDPAYEKAVRADVAEILEDRSHPATSLLNRKGIEDLLARPLGTTSSLAERAGLERARSISARVKDYAIVLDV